MPLRFSRQSSLRIAAALVAAVILAPASQTQERPPTPRPIVLIGGTLVDGSGAAARPNEALLVADGRIEGMGADLRRKPPRQARVIDADGKWILPGLIDGHMHLFQTGGLDARPDVVPNPDGRPYTDVVGAIRRNPQPYLRAYICSGCIGSSS